MIDKYSYMPGDAAIVLENEFTADGAQFIGWNTKADGSGTSYQPGDTVTFGSSDIVLYAQWDAVAETENHSAEKQPAEDGKILQWLKKIFS